MPSAPRLHWSFGLRTMLLVMALAPALLAMTQWTWECQPGSVV